MAGAVTTTVTELPESRVRVDAEVSPEEVERQMQAKARSLGRNLRIPGFRRGKVPPPVVIRRIGREAVLDETVRDSMGRWYVDAIDASGIAPVGDPKLDLDELPAQGQSLRFSIEIGVLPTARLGAYRGVEAPRREPAADEEAVQRELEALRERSARLETVERAAQAGDFVVIDYAGEIDGEPFPGGEGRDELVELGAGRVVPGLEEGLTGAVAGDERAVEARFPDDHAAEALAGKQATFHVTVKEVREKHLPELDDDFAADSAGFDSLSELREDIERRLREADEARAEAEFREAALDAVVDAADIDVAEHLVEARARDLWERTLHALSHQGISKDAYLRIAGKTEEQLLEEARPDAERALRREAVIAAVVAAEGLEPDEQALHEALGPAAEREGQTPAEVAEALRRAGRLEEVRGDLAAHRAVELIAQEAKPIPVEQARAREKLWTPGKGAPTPAGQPAAPAKSRIWTPGS
jgi:trigger factor